MRLQEETLILLNKYWILVAGIVLPASFYIYVSDWIRFTVSREVFNPHHAIFLMFYSMTYRLILLTKYWVLVDRGSRVDEITFAFPEPDSEYTPETKKT